MKYRTPTTDERDKLFRMILGQLGSQAEEAQAFLGMTTEQFAEIYKTTGEVRVVQDEGRDVGYLWIEERGRQLHIHAIILLPEARGRGVGTRVVKALEEEFSSRVDEIELGVQDTNDAAIRFYDRVGFRRTAIDTAPGFSIFRLSLRGTVAGSDPVS